MANWLCRNGFEMKWLEPSKVDKGHQVFIFDDSTKLRKCMEEFERKINERN